jgi:hypothetical protein
MMFYLLDLEYSRGSDLLVWWAPRRSGRVTSLEAAGEYSSAEADAIVRESEGRLVAVPRYLASEHACHVVVRDRRDDIVEEAAQGALRRMLRNQAAHPANRACALALGRHLACRGIGHFRDGCNCARWEAEMGDPAKRALWGVGDAEGEAPR